MTTAHELVGHLEQDPRAVAGVRVGTRGAPVLEVRQGDDGALDGLVRRAGRSGARRTRRHRRRARTAGRRDQPGRSAVACETVPCCREGRRTSGREGGKVAVGQARVLARLSIRASFAAITRSIRGLPRNIVALGAQKSLQRVGLKPISPHVSTPHRCPAHGLPGPAGRSLAQAPDESAAAQAFADITLPAAHEIASVQETIVFGDIPTCKARRRLARGTERQRERMMGFMAMRDRGDRQRR